MAPKLRIPLIVLGAVVLLAAAAFVALTLLNPNLANRGGLPVLGAATDPAGKKAGATFDVIPATEIPATNPELVGQLQNQQDNSLMVVPDTKGAAAPAVEVVITTQTRLYRNATGDQLRGAPPSGTTVQMVVVPYALAQLAAGDRIITWGQRRGDRIVAEVVLVEPQAGGAGSATSAP